MTQQVDVSTPSPRMAAMAAKRELINDLSGGTFAMRAAGTKWLPQHPAESEGVYKTRLEKTFLDNFFEDAIGKAVGRVFRKPIKLNEVPAQIEELLEDVDMQGSSLDAFAQDVGSRSLEAGISYVLVDMPPVGANVKTAAEEKAAGIRPYVSHIDPDNVIEILSARVGGGEVLQRVRILETAIEQDGVWGYKEAQRVRVLEMRDGVMCFDIYEQQKDKNTGKIEWVKRDELSGVTTFTEIFLVPFYSNRTGFMEGEPGFQDIAESTLEHWQVKSEYMHALSMQCFGMLTATGVEAEAEIQVGPAKVLRSTSKDATFTYTEPTGSGVTLSLSALQAIEKRIDTADVSLRVENAGEVTATAAALDSDETNAGLAAVAHGFESSWETVFGFMAEILKLGEDAGGEVEIFADLGSQRGTQQGLQSLDKARALGDLSRQSYLETLVWRGELPETFDFDKNDEELTNEGPALGTMGQGGQPGQKGNQGETKCPDCGAMVPSGDKKCPGCGAEMPMKGGGKGAEGGNPGDLPLQGR